MNAVWSKGASYFGIVFACAFATGAARVLFVAPKIGVANALLLEVPILIAASWLVARRLLRNSVLRPAQGAAMGLFAFLLTMVSEAALSFVMRGQSVAEWASTVASPTGMIGLAGQLAFAAMPFLVVRFASSSRTPNRPLPIG